jgi:deleted-in-malignant-brain-tumors protein 1
MFVIIWYTRTNSNVCSNRGDVRLVNGAGPYEGRVEICYNGEWKSVCQRWWSSANAKVVCTQLNYPPQGIIQCHVIIYID